MDKAVVIYVNEIAYECYHDGLRWNLLIKNQGSLIAELYIDEACDAKEAIIKALTKLIGDISKEAELESIELKKQIMQATLINSMRLYNNKN